MRNIVCYTSKFGLVSKDNFFKRAIIKDNEVVKVSDEDTFDRIHFSSGGNVIVLLSTTTGMWFVYNLEIDLPLGSGYGFFIIGDDVGVSSGYIYTTKDGILAYPEYGIPYIFRKYGENVNTIKFLKFVYPYLHFALGRED